MDSATFDDIRNVTKTVFGENRLPHAPRAIEDTGLDTAFLAELCAKVLLARGRQSLRNLAGLLGLPPSVVTELLVFMRGQRLTESGGHRGLESDAEFLLSETGRAFAREAMARCQYIGRAPVTLAAYRDRVAAHSSSHHAINAAFVRGSLRRFVIDPAVIDQVGAAMNSGRAMLIYGPAGSGKTFLAEQLGALQPGDIAVPHAITVGGDIIQVFDPLVHEPVASPASHAGSLVRDDCDDRWIRCKRPLLIAGGELTLQMLDLQFDASAGYYQAPPHMKANGGVFVVDDLGRQLVGPRELMNRWIVPLDRKRDFLSLHTGFRFAVPFDMTVIFSTNLRPDELADEAFLRRFGYKVHLGAMDRASYRHVFQAVCEEFGIGFDEAVFDWLLRERHGREGRELLACYPRDLLGRVRDFAIYEDLPARMTPESLNHAWRTYFFTTGADAVSDGPDVTTATQQRIAIQGEPS